MSLVEIATIKKKQVVMNDNKRMDIDLSKIENINKVIETYFTQHEAVQVIPVKTLMPDFIKAGIFAKDFQNGKPIREILRDLKRTDQLDLIPFLHAEEKDNHVFWYFIPKGAPIPTTPYKQAPGSVKKEKIKQSRLLSDETYVLDLCDTILELKAQRQKRFDFLQGDLHQDGVTRTKLPVDAYYAKISTVIELDTLPPTESVDIYAKSTKKTASGVNRSEQRRMYDQLRAIELPKHDIELVEISFTIFNCDEHNKIIRNPEQDMLKIKEVLSQYELKERVKA